MRPPGGRMSQHSRDPALLNLRERLLMLNWCSVGASGALVRNGGNVALTDTDVALIEGAYANLQLSDADRCASGPGVMTLDVSIDALRSVLLSLVRG